MRVCVTGGSGFIGSYFHEAFAAAGVEQTVLDLVAPADARPNVRCIQGDIRDEAALHKAVSGCDALLHLAAAHHDFGITREEFFSVNEGGARAICKVADACGVRRICFYSSVAVYGEVPEPRTEQTVPQPTSDYGQSKLAGERVFREWAKQEGRSCLIIRPTVTFGPRNFANMYSLIHQIESGRFLPVGSGGNVKSLAYVQNIVEATLYLWNLGGPMRLGADDADSGCATFNYIDKPDLTSRQIVDACYESLGKRPPRLRVPLWLAVLAGLPFDLLIALTGKNLAVSTARIRKLCVQTKFEADKVRQAGFAPRISLREGLDRMVRWYMDKGKHLRPLVPGASD